MDTSAADADRRNRAALTDAINAARHVGDDLHAIALRHIDTAAEGNLLLHFDDTGPQPYAAVAAGNPDTATNLAILIPGVGNSAASLPKLAAAADNLRSLADAQTLRTGATGTTSVIAWLGYTPPTLADALHRDTSAASYQAAHDGAGRLDTFTRTWGAGKHVTVIGHSYGSVVAGTALLAAAADGRRLCDRFVACGSPGLGADDVGAATRVGVDMYLIEAFADPVAGLGWFGADPDTLPGPRRLSARRHEHLAANRGHHRYLAAGTTSQWNLAAVSGGNLTALIDDPGRPAWTRTAARPIKTVIGGIADIYHSRGTVRTR